MGMPYTVLMPAIATKVLHGDSHTLGFLMTASGCGALAGALYLASRRTVLGLGRVIAIAACTFGVGLVLFSLSRSTLLSLLVLPVAGAGMMVTMASTNTVLQTIVEERLRGRVMAFYAMAFLGTAPIGSLIAGRGRGPHRSDEDDHARRTGVHRRGHGSPWASEVPRARATDLH